MSYDGKILRRALVRFDEAKQRRAGEYARRRREVYAQNDRIREIDAELRGTMSKIIASALAKGTDPVPAIRVLRDENLDLQRQRAELLVGLGYPMDYLEERPGCPLCDDTGYRGGEMCRWYSDQRAPGKTKSAREHMEWVYDTCVEYAHNFGKKPANLLLFGRPGLGKTHLSAAIAREVSGKGFSVVYDTAGHIFERFEAQKFGRDEAERDVERVLNCDLLILDDLGTEMPGQFTNVALYSLINDRLLAGKPTIISTNLTTDDIGKRYTPQIASRLRGSYRRVPFVGDDIRMLKNGGIV